MDEERRAERRRMSSIRSGGSGRCCLVDGGLRSERVLVVVLSLLSGRRSRVFRAFLRSCVRAARIRAVFRAYMSKLVVHRKYIPFHDSGVPRRRHRALSARHAFSSTQMD